jgi:hypothetical protein
MTRKKAQVAPKEVVKDLDFYIKRAKELEDAAEYHSKRAAESQRQRNELEVSLNREREKRRDLEEDNKFLKDVIRHFMRTAPPGVPFLRQY